MERGLSSAGHGPMVLPTSFPKLVNKRAC